ncbi:hypothetical protein ASE85_05455 [Sphingobium sp. Leaf26]|uniref:hypothetical protein n=1 Tax=Sphingobium sp. Leaf26 TaxID=1735693 RepID=UPI0006F300B5|nr:hypothetical protein [Sphingobium sp. Leaf26]KQN04482.1 hypothetical protein ASE85_05455 [Sphingobium sp. Leaf26]
MLIFVLVAMAVASTPPETDVLAQLQAGKVLCSNPDAGTKTCSTIDTFSKSADGTIIDVGEILISPDQPVTLEVSTTVQIESGTICGMMALGDLEKGQVRVNGTLLPPERNAAVMNKLVEKLKPLAGRKVCEALRLQDGQLMKYGQVERIDINLPGKPVRWVIKDDGYKVAPR